MQRFLADENSSLDKIITADETWVHHYMPLLKHASMMWKQGVTAIHKNKTKAICQQGHGHFVFDTKGPIFLKFMPGGTTINTDCYVDTLMKLHRAVKSKRCGPILLHDNATPHATRITQSMLKSLHFDQISQPPYSPDLSPCDYSIFGQLKVT